MSFLPLAYILAYIGPGSVWDASSTWWEQLLVATILIVSVLGTPLTLACGFSRRFRAALGLAGALLLPLALALAGAAVLLTAVGFGLLLVGWPMFAWSLAGLVVVSMAYARFWITTPRSWPA